MRHATWAMGFLAAILAAASPVRAQEACADETYGTAVTWMKDVSKAAEAAREEKKLVMVVHLSGELDDPGMT